MDFFRLLLVSALLSLASGQALGHGYIFSKANEEMRDNVEIEIHQNYMLIHFESVYQGQIAPHIRLMIDRNNDQVLSRGEIDSFFTEYKNTINKELANHQLMLDDRPVRLNCVAALAPTLTSDSLLAPFYTELVFSVMNFELKPGENELIIDPNTLFEGGTHFLRLAKYQVDFTRDQENAIGRFIQINVKGSENIQFVSTYPGRIKQKDKMAQIYGVFYEKTPLMEEGKNYPFIKIKFKVS